MNEHTLDVVGGRVLDPGRGIDETATVSVADRIISGVGPVPDAGLVPGDRRTVDAAGLLVTPGLVDLHTHLFPGVSHYGIEPDTYCTGRGVTTAVDAGSAGAQTFPGLRRYVIERSATRILAFLNIAVQGMISSLVGELEDIRWGSPEQAIARARENPDLIVGIKVRLGYQMVGNDPAPALRLAREAADALGLPLMVHVIDIRPSLDWLLPYLGRGDVVTHCFHGNEGGILDARGRVLPAAVRARERGVLFDVGHGAGSFAYRVARAALAQDFPPDTVSSDLHAYNVAGPVYDQATTRRAGELGSLAPGSEADLTGFELRTGEWVLPDGAGESEAVETLVVPRLVVRAGRAHRLDPVTPGPVPPVPP